MYTLTAWNNKHLPVTDIRSLLALLKFNLQTVSFSTLYENSLKRIGVVCFVVRFISWLID